MLPPQREQVVVKSSQPVHEGQMNNSQEMQYCVLDVLMQASWHLSHSSKSPSAYAASKQASQTKRSAYVLKLVEAQPAHRVTPKQSSHALEQSKHTISPQVSQKNQS